MTNRLPEPRKPAAVDSLHSLAQQVDAQRRFVDARLRWPARWRGPLRRELWSHARSGDRERVADAFDWLRRLSPDRLPALDAAFLFELHDRAAGGRAYRHVNLRVGDQHDYPPPAGLAAMVERALESARANVDPAPITAARLHLALVAVHPFRDGNGRTARLAASSLLLAAGYRSSLFTSVEQHFEEEPRHYIQALNRFHARAIDHETCTTFLVRAMVTRSAAVSWFRERSARLRAHGESLGVPPRELEAELLRYDSGDRASVLAGAELPGYRPWPETKRALGPAGLSRLGEQLRRLRIEEQDDTPP
jgi:hypothetical protein